MTATTKAPKHTFSGAAKKEKGKTHATWPKGGSESVTVAKNK